uniref:LIM homeobox transcription factor 1-alpha n=1 Tax=Macrostomum lignano TaxID=282301 RepID=A0A1I8IV76_9PLAT
QYSPNCSSSLAVAKQKLHRSGQPASEPLLRCFACSEPIVQRYLLQVDGRQFHSNCLRCCRCSASLEWCTSCFCRQGRIFCRRDYWLLFGNSASSCQACRVFLRPGEPVMRARDLLYHPGCFACGVCGRRLATGDRFVLTDSAAGQLRCQLHSPLTEQPLKPAKRQRQRSKLAKAWRRQRRAAELRDSDVGDKILSVASDKTTEFPKAEPTSVEPTPQQPQQLCRKRRSRTSFKQQQLQAMKAHFQANPNPDSCELRLLASSTGLSKRVLQVWFQNSRAKHRRHLAKSANQDSNHSGNANSAANQDSNHSGNANSSANQDSNHSGNANSAANQDSNHSGNANSSANQDSNHSGNGNSSANQDSNHSGNANSAANQDSNHSGNANSAANHNQPELSDTSGCSSMAQPNDLNCSA